LIVIAADEAALFECMAYITTLDPPAPTGRRQPGRDKSIRSPWRVSIVKVPEEKSGRGQVGK
jgi:hypothetical protein